MARGIQTSPPASPAARLKRFVERADRIAAHPLAREFAADPTQLFRIVGDDFQMPLRAEREWYDLAVWIRPVMYLERDPLKIDGVLALVKRLAPDLRAVEEQHVFFGVREVPGDLPLLQATADPEDARYRLAEVAVGPPGSVPVIQLADIYFNGEMFHTDGKEREELPDSDGLSPRCIPIRGAAQDDLVHPAHRRGGRIGLRREGREPIADVN